MLARAVLRKGDRCGLMLFDSAVRGFLQPRPGGAGLSAISNALAAVQPTGQETSLIPLHEMMRIRHPRRSLLVVLSDLADKETTQRSRAALSALAHQHLVLFVGLRSPELHGAVRLVPESGRDIALNALALAMLRQRHEAIHGMVSAGVHVLDVEPTALTVPLVRRYLELRQRNLL
jgi:uncharacterized protein (DUF58 family)